MAARPRPRTIRAGPAVVGVVLALCAAAGVTAAYYAVFTGFGPHDDEGYILISLQSFLDGRALYDEVYTQYGPVFYELLGAVFGVLQLDVTLENGRLITLALWMSASALLGIAVLRLTRSVLLAVSVALLVLELLFTYPGEPLHPGHVLCALLALVVAAAAVLLPSRPALAMVVVGSGLAVATLIKVNVGAFAVISVAFACVFAVPHLSARVGLRIGAALVVAATPLALMAGKLDLGWVPGAALPFAVHVTMAALAVVVASTLTSSRPGWRVEGRVLLFLAAGFVVTAAVGMTGALALGTSVGGLVRGVIIDPLQQPDVLFGIVSLRQSAIDLGAVSLALALLVVSQWRQLFAFAWWPPILAVGRVAAGVTIWLAVIANTISGDAALGYAVPLLWLAAVPSSRDDGTFAAAFVRLLLPSLAVLQTLHAYPVSGSQVAFAAFLTIPAGAICIADGLADLRVWAEGRSVGSTSLVVRASMLFLAVLTAKAAFHSALLPFDTGRRTYAASVPLGLPTTYRIRVPAATAQTYQWVVERLNERCSTFISLPGLNSLYFFTGQQPPTALNAGTWMFLFNADQQERVVRAVEARDRLCVVRNASLVDFWRQGRPVPSRPLAQFIERNFAPAESFNGFELLVRKA